VRSAPISTVKSHHVKSVAVSHFSGHESRDKIASCKRGYASAWKAVGQQIACWSAVAMKFANHCEQVESQCRLLQFTVAIFVLMFGTAGVTMAMQALPQLASESQALGARTETQAGPGDVGSEVETADPHKSSELKEGSADTSAMNDSPRGISKASSVEPSHTSKPELNRNFYHKNKLEFSLDGGWLPINIPFVFDAFQGDGYTMTSLRYTLVPVIGSLRWQLDDIGGPWILRGNWDLELSGAVIFIPRGPETHYFAWIMGVRRNFVPRRGRFAPYFDGRLGLGHIDAKEPAGVLYAQGQDFTFTVNMGSGVRYNFNPRYAISAGLNWMHISNLYLSEPKFSNYGINVYGPMFGINVRLGKLGRHSSE
jgi:hypothetical protein